MTAEVVQTRTSDVEGDAAHIIFVPEALRAEGVTVQALVLRARRGYPDHSPLCGYTWVPQRDPAPLPVCARCLEIYRRPGEHRDDRDELPPP